MPVEPFPRIVDITQGSLAGKLARYSSVYLISSLITALTAFILLPINTRIFTQEEYGAITTIDSAADLILIFVSLNLVQAYIRYYHEYKEDYQKLCLFTSTIYWFIISWGIIAVTISLVVAGSLSPWKISLFPVLFLAFITPLLVQLSLLAGAFLQQNHRPVPQVSLVLTNFLTHAVIMLILVGVFKLSLTGKYLGVLCGGLLAAAISTWILAREGLLKFRFSRVLLLESLLFSIPLIPNITAGWITGLSDRILISIYGSLEETGVYNVGYLLGRGITIFSEAIFLVYGPMIFAMMKKDPQSAKLRIQRFIPYYFMFMGWMCLGLSIFAPEAISFLVPAQYANAAAVVPVVMSAYFIGSQYKTFSYLLSYEKKTALISTGGILQALVNFGANLVLIPLFGKMAAAWTTLAAIFIYALWMFSWSQKYVPLRLDIRRLLIPTACIGLAGLGAAGISSISFFSESPLLLIVLKVVLLMAILSVFWFSGCILPSEKQRILAYVRRA